MDALNHSTHNKPVAVITVNENLVNVLLTNTSLKAIAPMNS